MKKMGKLGDIFVGSFIHLLCNRSKTCNMESLKTGENMWVTFCLPSGTCLCSDCFYGFHVLKVCDFDIYKRQGLALEDGMQITPSLVSEYFQTCDKLFRNEFQLEPRSLEESCLWEIKRDKDYNTDLLPPLLKEKVKTVRNIPSVAVEWTIPSTLVKHLGLRIKFV